MPNSPAPSSLELTAHHTPESPSLSTLLSPIGFGYILHVLHPDFSPSPAPIGRHLSTSPAPPTTADASTGSHDVTIAARRGGEPRCPGPRNASRLQITRRSPQGFSPLSPPSNKPNRVSMALNTIAKETYDQAENHNIPRCIDHIHLPSDVSQTNRHDEGENQTEQEISRAGQRRC